MKYNNNEFKYVEIPKKKIGNIIIVGIGVLAILITGFLYAATLNKNAEIANMETVSTAVHI
ncbi:MAG: hypothetical protein K2M46_08445 [Lachnospiraceae bacterium]|nr:hypothetical protein [Lachnospiraceae bacterium]